MIPKPEGLKLPDCQCFQGNNKYIYLKAIDKSCSLVAMEVATTGMEIFICAEARDYFIALL